ncbi:metallopeptidase TldD-related protein [Streptacidiphilus jiangxiensis]|uniref:Predicted Zn-dependent protease or its inactivated homolog n=1 Tax=Streptacidiphilus jiangxiensis TaxID=235985 RepID=A0A1H7VP26_STRJI|nr:metallopeptidase TldD-related protein [Streptacidiphilus jiangxiensis]SEM11062.1 Predicted Zn-dependent protease or its inactivated homolog [Streptacidiphilus jiangxiensis]
MTGPGLSAAGSRPHELVERALELSRADGCVVIADEESTANLRWAGNSLTTNGVTRGRTLTVVATVDGQEGTAAGVVSREAVTRDDLESLVRAAEAAARAAGPAEDAQPLLPAAGPASADFADAPDETTAEVFAAFAPALGEAFALARKSGRLLYGFANHMVTSTYLGTSTGIRLRHDQPTGTLELNAKTADLSASAWAGAATRDFRDVDALALEAQLAQRLAWAERKVDLPAGRYETLLPPSALADLMIYMTWSAGGRDASEGRTVFSRPGGKTRIGEKLAQLPLTLRSDPAYPGLEAAPFVVAHASGGDSSVFDNGLPLAPTDWLREGELANLLTTRHSAGLTGLPVRPGIDNLVLTGPEPQTGATLEEMVARTERGLLLTCLWYIREVDPATLLLTGLTRDGVYLVENGEVTGAVNNFRFNESPVDLLGRITEVGRTERCLPREWSDWFTRTAMPPVRVRDFHMSSVSQAS